MQADIPPLGRHLFTVRATDRKSTRLNSSHANISYAVFCLKKKKTSRQQNRTVTPPSRLTPPHRTSPSPYTRITKAYTHVLSPLPTPPHSHSPPASANLHSP